MTPRYPLTITPEDITAHRERLCEWATANGLDPNDVADGYPIHVEKAKGGPVIRYRRFVLDGNGRQQINPSNSDEVWTAEHTAPCTVPPPDLPSTGPRVGTWWVGR